MHDQPHVFDRQIDNDIGDLGRLGKTDQMTNVLINCVPDLVPVVTVERDHKWEDFLTRD